MPRAAKEAEFYNLDPFDISDSVEASIDECKYHFRHMTRIRLMEKYLDEAFHKKAVRGFCHLVIGQEGLYSALKAMFEKNSQNKILTSYRCHGAAYATGCSIKEIVAENLGLLEGTCKGKGGSMHLYNNSLFGGHGIVGAQVPLATGVAYSIKYKSFTQKAANKNDKESFLAHLPDSICYSIYGDGASNQGQVFESLNMAKLYNLPIVYIVENNQYGMYTPIENVSLDDCFYKRGYKIPGIRISDTNIFRLLKILEFAEGFCMKHGPIIIQVDTYRICGHAAGDEIQYYKAEQEKSAEEKMDCLRNIRNMLEKRMQEKEIVDFEGEIEEEVVKEIESLKFDQMLGKSELFTDLYYN